MTALTMVNRAVAIAVRVSCDQAVDVEDLSAYARSVGRRLQGTYGAELRRLADAHPEMGSEELYAAVIAPSEFPHLVAENPHAAAATVSGGRDRARQANGNAHSPAGDELVSDWRDRLGMVRAAVGEPGPRVPEPIPDADPTYAAHFDELHGDLERGRERGAQDRQVRRDRAKESGVIEQVLRRHEPKEATK